MTAIHCLKCGTENPDQAKFCNECGSSLAIETGPGADSRLASLQQAAPQGVREKLRAAGESVEGERKPVTILFADIVGSTSIAEKLDPEEWKEVVAGAHQRVGEAIYRYEGTIAQLLGDGVLAFFGAPITHEDDSIRAVRAALDIQESMKTYRQELEGFVDGFQMRVGVNTGTVVIGDIGSDLHVEYLAIGDAVNVASRMESAAEPGTVLISATSARLIGDEFELTHLGVLPAKGKTEGIEAFIVTGLSGIPQVKRSMAGAQASYVGREDDLNVLLSKIQSLLEGEGQIVAVSGEPGIGKSRFAEEARKGSDHGEEAGIRWLEGRALSYGQGLSFWTMTQLLQSDLGIPDGAAAAQTKVALRARMRELLGKAAEDHYPYLAHSLGLTLDPDSQSGLVSLDGETLKRQTLIALAEYFYRVAEREPTVLVLEDFHWADPSSLEALARLFPLADRVSLMILLLMREERDHGSWRLKLDAEADYSTRFTGIRLRRLTEEETDEHVHRLLGVSEASEEIRTVVRSRAQGNPLHTEEVIHHLVEGGLIKRVNGGWQATTTIDGGGVPETLEGVLLARIDRLEEDVRNTLQLASVIGKSFLFRLLEVVSEAGPELSWHLSQLQRADLIKEKGRHPDQEYMFKHSLIQEATYNSLLHERRAQYHSDVGKALEQLFADRVEEFLGMLAHHFDAARDYDKSMEYLNRAGDKARLEDSLTEALDYYERVLTLQEQAGHEVGQAKTWLKISLVHSADFSFNRARDAQESAFRLQANKPQTTESWKRSAKGADRPKETLRHLYPRSPNRIPVLDSSKTTDSIDIEAMLEIFAGLAQIDAEMNVLPHVAKSWTVMEGGKRYVFHLREDVCWTDGVPITAEDFKWSWMRNLSQGAEWSAGLFADDIVGAREYREKPDAGSGALGIWVRDPLTLEVDLKTPVPYFPYLVAHPAMFPAPRHLIEVHGDSWTDPQLLVTNGPFQFEELNEDRGVLIRNSLYFGDFLGNVNRVVMFTLPDATSAVEAYLQGEADVVGQSRIENALERVPSDEVQSLDGILSTQLLIFNPTRPPLDNIDVRRALARSIDHHRNPIGQPATGGIVPPGMSGHSPDIGLSFSRRNAVDSLKRAGFPDGKSLGTLDVSCLGRMYENVFHQWEREIGLELKIRYEDPAEAKASDTHILAFQWVADYPDPDAYLREPPDSQFLDANRWGGRTEYDRMRDAALISQDRSERLEIFRSMDRYLVSEQVVAVALTYGTSALALVKPWVRGWRKNALEVVRLQDISIERSRVP